MVKNISIGTNCAISVSSLFVVSWSYSLTSFVPSTSTAAIFNRKQLEPRSISWVVLSSESTVQNKIHRSGDLLRCAFFRVITQRVVVISYRCFGTSYRHHLQGSRIPKKDLDSRILKMGPIACSETSVKNTTVRCIIPKKAQISSNSRRKLQITLITLVTSICPSVLPSVLPSFRLHVSALLSPDEFS
jgi:hypothetical protein